MAIEVTVTGSDKVRAGILLFYHFSNFANREGILFEYTGFAITDTSESCFILYHYILHYKIQEDGELSKKKYIT